MGAEFETGTVTIAVMAVDGLGIPFQPHRVPIAFHVDDVAAARATLEASGVRFRGETIDSGVCHQALFEESGREPARPPSPVRAESGAPGRGGDVERDPAEESRAGSVRGGVEPPVTRIRG